MTSRAPSFWHQVPRLLAMALVFVVLRSLRPRNASPKFCVGQPISSPDSILQHHCASIWGQCLQEWSSVLNGMNGFVFFFRPDRSSQPGCAVSFRMCSVTTPPLQVEKHRYADGSLIMNGLATERASNLLRILLYPAFAAPKMTGSNLQWCFSITAVNLRSCVGIMMSRPIICNISVPVLQLDGTAFCGERQLVPT